MQASLYPDGMTLNEGKRKICDITLANDEDSLNFIAKITHPVTGMTVYEMQEIADIITIQSYTDDMNGTRIEAIRPTLLSLLFTCGCTFTRKKWNLISQDIVTAIIEPKSSFFEENSVKMEWVTSSENELRVVAVTFGLALMVREAFPSLIHILKEFRTRHA
nr:Hypothetical protein CBG05904 [Haemonchus contortus]